MGFPGKKKSHSTKKFVLLYHASGKAKTPSVVRNSLHRGYPVVTYDYVLDCVIENRRLDTSAYIANMADMKSVTKEPALQCHNRSKQHFISMVKSKRKKTAKKAGKICHKYWHILQLDILRSVAATTLAWVSMIKKENIQVHPYVK